MSDTRLLTLVFEERDPAALHELADELSDPQGGDYGRYLTREALADLVLPGPRARQTVLDWLAAHGITVVDGDDGGGPENPQMVFLTATVEQIRSAFGPRVARWLANTRTDRAPRMEWGLPPDIAPWVQSVQILHDAEAGQRWIAANRWLAEEQLAATHAATGASVPEGLGGLTPADVMAIYDFPRAPAGGLRWTGEGETIGLFLFGAAPSLDDLEQFWRAHGIDRAPPRVVYVGPPPPPPGPLEALEAAMALQWAGALAPEAELVAYVVDHTKVADPWSAVLMAALADTANRPTILTTSWLIPERTYYATHGSRVITGLLDQCAAAGITVLSAAGDWGAFDGVPRTRADGRAVTDAPWPHAVFPAVETRVLGVGGTMVLGRQPLTEVAWSGPLPPKMTNYPFARLAGGGGFSAEIPIPDWQSFLVLSDSKSTPVRRWYARGTDVPAVIAYGRGFPDVALAAVGPSVLRAGDTELTATGYQAVTGGQWIDYAGGTSLGTPIWAAIIAQLNQARRAADRPRLGFCNPLLYAIANRKDAPRPFRDVTAGRTDVAVWAVNRDGKAYLHELPGFEARSDWDPVTGLGVPVVSALLERVLGGG